MCSHAQMPSVRVGRRRLCRFHGELQLATQPLRSSQHVQSDLSVDEICGQVPRLPWGDVGHNLHKRAAVAVIADDNAAGVDAAVFHTVVRLRQTRRYEKLWLKRRHGEGKASARAS